MALFSRKNLKTRKWVTTDDITLLLEDASRHTVGPVKIYSFIVDTGVIKDIEDLYREPVQLELRNILLHSEGRLARKYNFVTEKNIKIFENMLKEDYFYNRILFTPNLEEDLINSY